ncbi:MAG: hypothetical protein Q4A15_01710 [Prevotellaceae bacterium]|nr:hypothetical protein [Prevotellaceae bacterium]
MKNLARNNRIDSMKMLYLNEEDAANLYSLELEMADNARTADEELKVYEILQGMRIPEEDDDEEEDFYDDDDKWSYENDHDYSDDGCGEGYSCHNCPNFGCPANDWN